MGNKKNFCGASTHTWTAPLPKIFFLLFCFLLINCGMVFASSTVKFDLEDFVNKFDIMPESAKTGILNSTWFETVKEYNLNYDYIFIYSNLDNNSTIWNSNAYLGFYFTNNPIIEVNNTDYTSILKFEKGILFQGNNGTYRNNSAERSLAKKCIFIYSEPSITELLKFASNDFCPGISNPWGMNYTYNRSGYSFSMSDVNYLDGYEPIPEQPWFEFEANKVGNIQIAETSQNINCYYVESFKLWSNSYMTGRLIGYLYTPRGYLLQDIFNPVLNVTKSAITTENSWTYKEYDFFKQEETSSYIKYSINLRNDLVTAPYIYNINLKSINNLFDDININFAVINKSTTGGTITDNSGDIIPEESIKDETTLGDINNTIGQITEPYNPNNNILNNMSSGDIMNNIGYEQTDDPYQDLWDTIIDGLKETLTKNEDVIFELKFKNYTYELNSKNIYMPENPLKTFIGYFINVMILMKMFKFIKRTIIKISEGTMDVLDNVGCDIYFF